MDDNAIIDIKYVMINSSYNNRALANKKHCIIILNAMNHFSSIQFGEPYKDNSDKIEKMDKIHYIPSSDHIRLLYMSHMGYSWIDEKTCQGKIYRNFIVPDDKLNIEYVDKVRQELRTSSFVKSDSEHKIFSDKPKFTYDIKFDSGCFVFELDSETKIKYGDLLKNFVSELTKMRYCGFFNMDSLYSTEYCEKTKTILLKFDTESG